MKVRKLKYVYGVRSAGWYAGIWTTWNGLITAGKYRSPRYIKTLKLMDYVYVEALDVEVYGTAYYVGDGFLVRNYNGLSDENEKGEIVFVPNNLIDNFMIHKYVGGRDIFFDEQDEKHLEMSLNKVKQFKDTK